MRGKAAVITGASRGIGRAIALRLAERGARCVLCARDRVALADVVKEIESFGGLATSVALDLREQSAPGELARTAVERYSGIDIVVNNAGATQRAEFVTLSDEVWEDGFALKFFGAVRLCRAAWPLLQASGGSIVNIAGTGGRTPGAEFAVGGSVNAALLSFTKSLAETGIRDGVQVNAVNPGLVRTDRFQKRLQALAVNRGIDIAAAEAALLREEKVTRVGEPGDIANLVAFIVSPEGRFLQGSLIDMDGGSTKTI